jgi:hypothetical protein
LASFLLVVVVLWAAPISGGTSAAWAAGPLPPGVLVADQDGLQVGLDGVYLVDARELLPGQRLSRQLVIRDEVGPGFRLWLWGEPVGQGGPAALLDQVRLRLSLDGRVLYEGRFRGDEGETMTVRSLDLGWHEPGRESVLKIEFKVADELELGPERSWADMRWHFTAVRDRSAQSPGTGTGDAVGWLWPVAGGLALAAVGLVIAGRRERKTEVEAEV